MGVGSWMARKGNIGGVPRWAGKNYIACMMLAYEEVDTDKVNNKESFEKIHKTIYEQMIKNRYHVIPNVKYEIYLLEKVHNGKIFCLIDLCIEILKVEADLHKNDYNIVHDWLTIIYEELKKKGPGPKSIFGWDEIELHANSRTKNLLEAPDF